MFKKLRFKVEKEINKKRKLIRKHTIDFENKTQQSIDIKRNGQKRIKHHRVWKNHKLIHNHKDIMNN